MKQQLLLPLLAVLLCMHIADAQITETFESQTLGAADFTSNARNFTLTNKFRIYSYGGGLGYQGSNKFVDNVDNPGLAQVNSIKTTNREIFTVKSFWLYTSDNSSTFAPSNNGSLIIRGKKIGATQYTITKTSGFNNNAGVNNGFVFVDFTTEGGSNNSTTHIDELEFSFGGAFLYVAVDNFIWQASTLPVELVSFTGTKNRDAVVLNWNTASEINNKQFILLRSADGKAFEPVKEIKGNGNTSAVSSYAYTDAGAAAFAAQYHTGYVYYRLRQVDYNGAVHDNNMVSIRMGQPADASISVHPNPFSSALQVSITAPATDQVSIDIIDITGKTVFTSSAMVHEGTNDISLPGLADLKNGMYFIRLDGKDVNRSVRIVKNN